MTLDVLNQVIPLKSRVRFGEPDNCQSRSCSMVAVGDLIRNDTAP